MTMTNEQVVIYHSKSLMLVPYGLPGSGKSKFALEWLAEDPDGRVRINYDEMRIARYGENWHFNRKQEDEMKAAAIHIAEEAIMAGLSVVIDNTNLSPSVRHQWQMVAESLGADFEEKQIEAEIFDCISRDRERTGRARVGRAVIERMALFNGLIDWEGWGGDFIIVDIDGTIADCRHRLHHIKPTCLKCGRVRVSDARICQRPVEDGKPVMCAGEFSKKNWPGFFDGLSDDKPIQIVVEMLRRFDNDHAIILLTGRDASVGVETEEWLDKHDVPYDFLFMRQPGDNRKDYEHKLAILEKLPKERIALVLEDRNQCVEMYRKQGLRVWQVGDGDF